MERRNFFKNLTNSKKSKRVVIRPPYFEEEGSFEKCVECDGKCADVCETKIIFISEDNKPFLDFSQNGCTFCDECAKICPEDVLKVEFKDIVDAEIVIDPKKCMSWSKNICFSCKDPCLENAIEFAGMFYPEIIADKCTACGFCIKYCPTEAIIVIKREKKESENV
jgi:ferredoxin-type protein NapF